jgi:uncharacterized membrane protein
MSTQVLDSIDVDVPVSTAYNQWTQFETFPKFMEGVERIDQITPTKTHWVTKIAGVQREFDAEVTEQHPDERVAWTTENGTHQSGVVTFHRISDTTTRVKGDLKNFKSFIEKRGVEEDGWRGDVDAAPQTGTGTV